MLSPYHATIKSKILSSDHLEAYSYKDLPQELKNDDEVTILYLRKMPWLARLAPEKFLKNKQLVWELMEKDPWVLSSVNKELFKDLEFVLISIEKTRGLAYFFCKEPVVSNPQVIRAASSQGLVLNS